jgi:tetratricopeptide (TPR) repeat protein
MERRERNGRYRIVWQLAAALLAFGIAAQPAPSAGQAPAWDAAACARADGDDSIAACSRMLARNPKNASAAYHRGRAYARKRDHDRAIADLDEAIRLDSRYVPAYTERGVVYNAKGEQDRAIGDYNEAIRLDPRNPVPLNHRGWAYYYKRDYERAIADFDRALKLDPALANAYAGRGSVYRDKGDHDRAMADFDEAIREDPRQAAAYVGRGVIYIRNGEHDQALANFEELLRINPNSAEGYTGRGDAYSIKGDYGRALAEYDQAIRLQPKYARAYGGRCDALNGKGEYDRAIADCEEAIRLAPNLANARSYRGFAYGKKGDFVRAMADLDKAIALNPKAARGYGSRGAILELRGDLDRAIADYDEALKIAPGLSEVRRSRERAMTAKTERVAPPPVIKPLAVAPDRRVALVIGNSQYRSVTFLPNPRRDAGTVADALRDVGFEVDTALDLDRDGMVKALHAFRDKADKADWALIYFAGHGIEVEKTNYLIPTDARLADDRDVKTEALSSEELLSAVANARQLRMVVLDACRSNPFQDQMRRSGATRGFERGLAPPRETGPGTLVVYAAKEGEVAADDAGGANSPFALALVAEIKVPGVEIRRVFDNVRDDVLEATGNRQQPFTYGSLPGRQDFYFMKTQQNQ